MKNLERDLFNDFFSHIYVEKKAKNHLNTQRIISRFKDSKIIEIDHYKDVFSRRHQDYVIQKNSQKLILAVKEDNFIYKGAEPCDDFGNDNFYYTSTMMNCIYDCEYCYLQGMYSSSNIVIFVNIEEIFREVEKLLEKHPIYLCISYDSDILALENIVGYGRSWLEFAAKHENLKIELRTKSANFKAIEDLEPIDNVILAWTLSPEGIIEKHEQKTPSLEARVSNARSAIDRGWKVRICFDPMIYVSDWREQYKEMVETTFREIDGSKIHDVSIGLFRVSKEYIKTIKKVRTNSFIINYPFETSNGVCTYGSEVALNMVQYVYRFTLKHVNKKKIYI